MHITDHIRYPFIKILVFVICYASYRYCILVFVLFCRVTNIQIFLFESKRITDRIKEFTDVFPNPDSSTC